MNTLSALRETDYEKFVDRFKRAITRHQAYGQRMADDLDVNASTIKRWINADDELKAFVVAVRKQRGRYAA